MLNPLQSGWQTTIIVRLRILDSKDEGWMTGALLVSHGRPLLSGSSSQSYTCFPRPRPAKIRMGRVGRKERLWEMFSGTHDET